MNLFKGIAFTRAVCHQNVEKIEVWAKVGGTVGWLQGNMRARGLSLGIGSEGQHKG